MECGEGGIGTGSHFCGGGGGGMFESGISQEVTGRRGYAFPEQSHLSEMRFAEQLLGHELMGIYFNDRLKGF